LLNFIKMDNKVLIEIKIIKAYSNFRKNQKLFQIQSSRLEQSFGFERI
jgi:hypothetical protein